MDHADYVLMRAPKPTLLCTATHDFFDIHGAWDCFRQAKRFYTRLGFSERVDLIETDDRHGFSQLLRVGMVRWMRRWLLEIDQPVDEPELAVASDLQLQCTPEGQVMQLKGARSTYDLNAELEDQLAGQRKEYWHTASPSEALKKVRQISGIRALVDLPEPECDDRGSVELDHGVRLKKLVLQPEPGVWLPALAFIPTQPSGQAYLYVHADGKQADAGPGGPIQQLVGQGHMVLAIDVRGVGETAPREPGQVGIARYIGSQWKDFYLAYLLGTSYLAMRAEDLLVSARFLAHYKTTGRPNRVHLISVGRTGPPALHAVALEPDQFASVLLKNSLESWSDVIRTPLATNQFENVVHGALRTYDLPNLRAMESVKEKIKVVDPFGPLETRIEPTF
jgi:hypothetical protein